MRSLRARILAGDRVIGTFLKTPDPHMVELLGLAGLDFIVADSEHAPIDLGALDLMAMAGRSVSLPILFRARGHDPAMISPGFDAGVTGVMVPHVRTAQNAERIADARLISLPKVGHMSSLEAPRQINAVIDSFIRRIESRGR